jgi:hypothetical protein
MSDIFHFLQGRGHLSRKAGAIARKYGCVLVNYTNPGCGCGYGCDDDCPSNARHWFNGPNYGRSENDQLAAAIRRELVAAKLIDQNGGAPKRRS